MKTLKVKTWGGAVPQTCDICGSTLADGFVDGRTRMGSWGFLCSRCHEIHGVGLGMGYGQQYKKTVTDTVVVYVKVAG